MATSFAVPVPRRLRRLVLLTAFAALAVPHVERRFRLLRLAAQTLRPAASRQRVLRRPAHRRGRRRPRGVDDLSLRHRHLRPRRHRGLRIDVGQDRLGAAAARNDRDPDGRRHRLRLLAHHSGCPQRRVRRRLPDRARPHLQGLGARAPRRARRRPRRRRTRCGAARSLPTRTRRGRSFMHSASSETARRSDTPASPGSSILLPRSRTRPRWSCPGAGAASPSCPRSSSGGWSGEGDRRPDGERRSDFSRTIPAPDQFAAVYAPWTRQNHAWRPGRYRLNLARDWDSRAWADGGYRLEVLVVDTRGNRSTSSTVFSVDN